MPSWLPTPAKLWKTICGARLFFMIKKLAKEREKEGRREDDAVQKLLDRGDTPLQLVEFVVICLFAGQANTGVNAGWCISYLGAIPEWRGKVRGEVEQALKQYGGEGTLLEKMQRVPFEVWDTGLPTIEYVTRETIRSAFCLVGYFHHLLKTLQTYVPRNRTEIPYWPRYSDG